MSRLVKNGPDVYLGDVIWPAQFAHDGLARALDNEFDPDFWKQFPSKLLSSLRYQNRTYAVPLLVAQGMLYYRKDLVATAPTTWEQLEIDAKNLLDQHKVEYGFVWHGAPYEGLTCIWTEMLADAGGRTLNDTHTRSQINSSQARQALTFLGDLVSKGISPKEVTDFREPDANRLFASGQAAFLRGWNSAYARIGADIYDKVGVAPLPTFAEQSGSGYSTTGGWNLFINPHSQRLDAAKTFIKWMTGVQAQQILARFSQIPVNVTVQGDSTTRENPAVAVGLGARPVGRPSDMPAYPAVSQAVYSNVNDAVNGKSLPEDALRDADQEINRALR
jgi:multiple sugar transport system substrate-binding protein